MAKKNTSETTPETTEKQPRKRGPKAAQAELKPTAEIMTPLKVEINFPIISDLKQALAFDANNNLFIAVQFKARVVSTEVFRLINLLTQPNQGLFAVIGSNQAAMDFKFDPKADTVEIVRAAKALPVGTSVQEKGKPAESKAVVEVKPEDVKGGDGVFLHSVTFNHVPEDARPYGVLFEYVNGTGEIKSAAGRGMNPTEAIISGLHSIKIIPAELKEPFEIIAALKKSKESDALVKTIRAIEVGSFDLTEANQGGKASKAKGA